MINLLINERGLIMDFRNDIKRLEGDIHAIRSQLSSLNVDPTYVNPRVVTATEQLDQSVQAGLDEAILRQKCRLLKAQIQVISTKEFINLPKDASVERCVLKEDYRWRTAKMKECKNFLQTHKNNLTQDIERERKLRIELEALIQAVNAKVQETDHLSKKDVFKRLEQKTRKLEKINKEKALQMDEILDRDFPLPDAESFAKGKKKIETVTSMKNMRLETLLPLKDIVKSLIHNCLERPNDPYILTDHRHWPPYVTLLVECDIALRHPADGSRIKLFPFYL